MRVVTPVITNVPVIILYRFMYLWARELNGNDWHFQFKKRVSQSEKGEYKFRPRGNQKKP